MRIKAFLATYLLFLLTLFSCFSIIQSYMTESQMKMYMEKSAAEYQTISATLVKDIATLRTSFNNETQIMSDELDILIRGYAVYYKRNNISIEFTDWFSDNTDAITKISFIKRDSEYFIYATGKLPEFDGRLDYYFNITENIIDMNNIKNTLLLICCLFAAITALILGLILTWIFKPLTSVSKISRKIAGGHYAERINVKGRNELATMADDFNSMAHEIERQISVLEDEAVSKQQFIDNFAHEIRTPLTSIYGYAEYMQKAPVKAEEIIDSTQFIMDSADHMKNIANSLLELATLRNYTPVKSEIQISTVFEDVKHTLKKAMSEKAIKLICESGDEVLYGQYDLIKSLLVNLCLNSINACPRENGVLMLKSERLGKTIILSITDNGCGIPKESLSKVTEPFYRVDKVRSREQGGAGLGLALCQQIVLAHGAEMTVTSELEKGTNVSITFTTP